MVEKPMDPYPSVEARVLERLAVVVGNLPQGTAELYVGKNSSLQKNLFPYFRISPQNSKSAAIEGYVYNQQGIDFKIGHGTGGEIYVSSKRQPNPTGEDRFFRICHAVFTTHFSEELIYSSSGRVIWSRIMLEVERDKMRVGGHQVFWWLFPNRTVKHFSYEPYY
jgi:hypothetical protein